MDITTILGLLATAGIVVLAVLTGQLTAVFFNVHGISIVCGGTAAAMLINTPVEYLVDAAKCLTAMFTGVGWSDPRTAIPAIVTASQNVHARGIKALRDVDPAAGNGFLLRASQVALEFDDPEYVRDILENLINQDFDHKTEVVNVFRTMGVLAPMFGLVGTLIGIIDVLKHISNPELVGPSMAVAVTTAFYGILLANLVAVPLAGKLRLRHWQEYQMKRMIADAVMQMLKGTVPALLERRLQSFLVEI